MAFDGVVIANIVYDMNRLLTGGRIYKIYQPEADELLLVVKNNKETYRLLISAGASLPLIYFTTKTKANPMTAPNFCMLLRKYISNGRIIEITQPGMERIVEITIEHLNELGDTCRKKMVIEIMGKHSNIIFIDEMAFYELDALHNIIIPKNVAYVGEQAFKYCRNLRCIQFNNPNCIIGQGVFHGCYELVHLELPKNLTDIPKYCMYDCRSLQEIEIPKNVENIGDKAFAFNWSMKEIQIPDGVEHISYSQFMGCDKLKIHYKNHIYTGEDLFEYEKFS